MRKAKNSQRLDFKRNQNKLTQLQNTTVKFKHDDAVMIDLTEPVPHTGILAKSDSGWYRITGKNVFGYNKENLMCMLLKVTMPQNIDPIGWTNKGDKFEFYVNNVVVAKRLHRLKNYASMPDGKLVALQVSAGLPNVRINENIRHLLMTAITSCYDVITDTIDLSNFHASKELKPYFCGLVVPVVMQETLTIIGTSFKLITTLNLSRNNLHSLKELRAYADVLLGLKEMDLSYNSICDIQELQNLNDYNLNNLTLTGNPINKATHEDICAILPMLRRLNGISIKATLPGIQYAVSNAQDSLFVETFLKTYYQKYDNDRRQLMDLYCDNARFSLSLPLKDDILQTETIYNMYNHNLCRKTSSFALSRKLIAGKEQVIALLTRLPNTRHSMSHMQYHLMNYKLNQCQIIVSGLFIDAISKRNSNNGVIREFCRCFILKETVQQEWIITNDMLFISDTKHQTLPDVPLPAPAMIVEPINLPTPRNVPQLLLQDFEFEIDLLDDDSRLEIDELAEYDI